MTDTEDPPSLAERYGRATTSSHLKLKETRCDVDYLIAAGWLKDGLGTLLFRLRGEFDKVRAEVRAGPLNRTEMFLVLSELKTLRSAREALCAAAIALATKQAFMQDDGVVMAVAGRVLDVWLDERCQSCEGRGFNGGEHRGERQISCRWCRGSGVRRATMDDTAEERRFSRLLQDHIAERLGEVEGAMKARLRQQSTPDA